MNKALEELRWKKFPILNDGFVCLVDAMGEDASVVQAAKISYGKDIREEDPTFVQEYVDQFPNMSGEDLRYVKKKKTEDLEDKNRTLLRYLMRNRHTTPFEMCEVKFLIRIPMDAWRQMVRHRTANINEYSTRYSEAIDSRQTTSPEEWRLQAGSNKQGSDGFLTDWPEKWNTPDPHVKYPLQHPINTENSNCKTPGQYLSAGEEVFHEFADILYRERIEAGVAREQARKDLPLSTYTEAYWKCDLHNIFHFLGLRMDSHAQLEIRLYANAIGHIVEQLFPQCWEAFQDYRFQAMQLSRMDILAIHQIQASHADRFDLQTVELCLVEAGFTNKREKEECIEKMKRLRIL